MRRRRRRPRLVFVLARFFSSGLTHEMIIIIIPCPSIRLPCPVPGLTGCSFPYSPHSSPQPLSPRMEKAFYLKESLAKSLRRTPGGRLRQWPRGRRRRRPGRYLSTRQTGSHCRESRRRENESGRQRCHRRIRGSPFTPQFKPNHLLHIRPSKSLIFYLSRRFKLLSSCAWPQLSRPSSSYSASGLENERDLAPSS